MTEKLKKVAKEEIAKLSTEAQDAIAEFDWVKTTEEIGKIFSLSETEINNFQIETLLVMTGLEEPNLYAQNVEQEVKINKEIAKKITDEVFEKVFKPIKNIMEENIKKSIKGKDMHWQQSVDFILSGGNYSVLVSKTSNKNSANIQKTDKLLGGSNILETKGRLLN